MMIWEKALPDYGTVPVVSIINDSFPDINDSTEPSTTMSKVTWAIESLPRCQWPNELILRNNIIRNLYNASFEARQAVTKRFPAVLGPQRREMFFSPTNDLLLLARTLTLDILFVYSEVSINYVGDWNRSISKLAIEHVLLAPLLANFFQEANPLTNIGHDVMRGFMGVLNEFTNLKQLSLVNSRKILLSAWNNTPEEQQSQMRQQLKTAYSSGVQMIPSTDVPDAETFDYHSGPFRPRHITLLKMAVENFNRIIRGVVQGDESLDFIKGIELDRQRFQQIEIRKMYHLSTELQGLCLT